MAQSTFREPKFCLMLIVQVDSGDKMLSGHRVLNANKSAATANCRYQGISRNVSKLGSTRKAYLIKWPMSVHLIHASGILTIGI